MARPIPMPAILSSSSVFCPLSSDMATNPAPRQFSGLARALVQHGLLAEAEAQALQDHAATSNSTFVDQILVSKRMTAMELAEFTSQDLRRPAARPQCVRPRRRFRATGSTPRFSVLRRVLPLHKRGNRLFVATSDLDQPPGAGGDPVQDQPGHRPDRRRGRQACAGDRQDRRSERHHAVDADDDRGSRDRPRTSCRRVSRDRRRQSEVEDAPVVKYIQKILLDAISAGASDIHFEPFEKFYRIRYRLDGVLIEDRAAAAGRSRKRSRRASRSSPSSTSPRSACRRTAG